jgi:Tfp pilus assembly protein PilV
MSCRTKNTSNARGFAARGFTLLEVMIAVGILFMCLFAVLALVGNSLRSARRLQQHRTLDTATVSGLAYVAAANTNQLTEDDPGDLHLDDLYPDGGYKGKWYPTLAGTNGLWQIDVLVERNNRLEVESHFMVFNPGAGNGQGVSKNLPNH